MSILIKGQELPISCGDCMELFLTEGRNKCPFLWINFGDNSEYQNKKRMPDCPLVEVPEPHGRLIDADALSSQFHKDTGRLHLITTHGFVSECIEDASTVIEAESEFEND